MIWAGSKKHNSTLSVKRDTSYNRKEKTHNNNNRILVTVDSIFFYHMFRIIDFYDYDEAYRILLSYALERHNPWYTTNDPQDPQYIAVDFSQGIAIGGSSFLYNDKKGFNSEQLELLKNVGVTFTRPYEGQKSKNYYQVWEIYNLIDVCMELFGHLNSGYICNIKPAKR